MATLTTVSVVITDAGTPALDADDAAELARAVQQVLERAKLSIVYSTGTVTITVT